MVYYLSEIIFISGSNIKHKLWEICELTSYLLRIKSLISLLFTRMFNSIKSKITKVNLQIQMDSSQKNWFCHLLIHCVNYKLWTAMKTHGKKFQDSPSFIKHSWNTVSLKKRFYKFVQLWRSLVVSNITVYASGYIIG